MISASRALLARQWIRSMSTGANAATANTISHNVTEQTSREDDLYRHICLKCSGHEVEVLDSYEQFLKQAAGHLDIEHTGTEAPFRFIKRRTLLASRFVHKKVRTQYEYRNYYRNMTFKNLTGSTADTFLEYAERNLPEGVLMIVERHRLSELPFDLTTTEEEEVQTTNKEQTH